MINRAVSYAPEILQERRDITRQKSLSPRFEGQEKDRLESFFPRRKRQGCEG